MYGDEQTGGGCGGGVRFGIVCGVGRYKSRIQQQTSVFGRRCGLSIYVYHRTCFGSTAYLSLQYYPRSWPPQYTDTAITPPPPFPSVLLPAAATKPPTSCLKPRRNDRSLSTLLLFN